MCRAQLIKLALVSVDKPSAGESSCLCLAPSAAREAGFSLLSLFHSASVTRSVCSGLGSMRAAVMAGPEGRSPLTPFPSQSYFWIFPEVQQRGTSPSGAVGQSVFLSLSWIEKAFIADVLQAPPNSCWDWEIHLSILVSSVSWEEWSCVIFLS